MKPYLLLNFKVLSNLYSVHMDPEVWSEPDKFSPDRFIDDSGSLINKEFVIPFSLGNFIHHCSNLRDHGQNSQKLTINSSKT